MAIVEMEKLAGAKGPKGKNKAKKVKAKIAKAVKVADPKEIARKGQKKLLTALRRAVVGGGSLGEGAKEAIQKITEGKIEFPDSQKLAIRILGNATRK